MANSFDLVAYSKLKTVLKFFVEINDRKIFTNYFNILQPGESDGKIVEKGIWK
jgi:hypothetical protein